MITVKQLIEIGVPKARSEKYIDSINDTMAKYSINTRLRICHFLAQILHESGLLLWPKELANGTAYEGRKDLGNTNTGDGIKYKGRGFIQITGRYNYAAISNDTGIDFLNNPTLLESPQYAALSAGWFWNKRNLNNLADKDGLTAITKIINGGTNGMPHRLELLAKCKSVIQ